jgi:hypothetical protein
MLGFPVSSLTWATPPRVGGLSITAQLQTFKFKIRNRIKFKFGRLVYISAAAQPRGNDARSLRQAQGGKKNPQDKYTYIYKTSNSQCLQCAGMPLIRCKAPQSHSLSIVLRNTSTVCIHEAQVVLSVCMPLIRCKAPQSHSLSIVLRNTFTVVIPVAQVVLSVCMPLIRCKAVPSHSLSIVLRNIFTVVIHEAQVVLSACMPLIRCKAVPSHSLSIVLRNAQSRIVAFSNHKLPKAAAHRLALPSQRKPSRYIFSNAPAVDIAATESALAVCAAQRRPS